MTSRRRLPCPPSARRRAYLALVLLALAAWLDRDGCIVAQQADVFTAIWGAIQIVGTILGDVGGAIATSLEGVVLYLANALAWLGGRVAQILLSTGSMFARVWDGVKVLWNDVLKPALVWIDRQLTRLHDWLKDTFGPVFKWLARVRDELRAIYTRFVRPIIDTIEFIRQINRVLLAFHIRLLQQLDATLQQVEQRIEAPFLWVNQKLTEIWNALDLIVNEGGFFQKLTMLKSLSRYAPEWMAMFWTRQVDPTLQHGSDYDRARDYPSDEPFANAKELAQFYRGEPSRVAEPVAALIPIWRQAVGLDEAPLSTEF